MKDQLPLMRFLKSTARPLLYAMKETLQVLLIKISCLDKMDKTWRVCGWMLVKLLFQLQIFNINKVPATYTNKNINQLF